MAYRDDTAALVAQCDALRRDLGRAEIDAHELARLQRELDVKSRELEALRAQLDPALVRARRLRSTVLAVGLATAGLGAWLAAHHRPVVTSAAWFAASRPHCNPLEARTHLERSRPPVDAQAPGYLATCWALGGHIDEARRVLEKAGPRKATALSILFEIAHPIADRGDDQAAGPIMGLILEMWPQNYMAWYHAGMSDYAGGDTQRARERLTMFLSMYSPSTQWRVNAEQALAAIAAGRAFGDAFAGKRDPRVE